MPTFDRCESCLEDMPAGNLHCYRCGTDLPPPAATPGGVLIQLYPAPSQADVLPTYRREATRLGAAGWRPVAHSWGDERPGTSLAVVFGYAAATVTWGTLLVTYRPEDRT